MRGSRLREGDPPPDGVGTLRRFAVGPGGSQEEVVAFEPPRHLGYVAVRGLPVRHYRADVHLDDVPGADGATGTRVTWRCEVEPKVPGTGPLLRAVLRRMVAGFARRVCRYADRRLPDGPPRSTRRARARDFGRGRATARTGLQDNNRVKGTTGLQRREGVGGPQPGRQ